MSNTRPNLIFEPRFHPKTSARDLASLTNALARLKDEEQLASGSPNLYFRRGTLILEPGPAQRRASLPLDAACARRP